MITFSVHAARFETNDGFSAIVLPEMLLGVGARSAAMGGAGGVMSDDLPALYWNPAGLAAVTHSQVQFEHNAWFGDMNQELFAGCTSFAGGTAAAGVYFLNLGEIESVNLGSDGEPEVTGERQGLFGWGVNAGFALPLSPAWSAGLAFKSAAENLGSSSLMLAALDAGVRFAPTDSGVRAAAVLMNLALPLEGYGAPTGVRLGAGYHFQVLTDQELRTALEIELPLGALDQGFYHAGAEYALARSLFLRGGYQFTTYGAAQTPGGFTAGLGVVWNAWQLAYAFAQQGGFGAVHRLSVGLDLETISLPAPVTASAAKEHTGENRPSWPELPTQSRVPTEARTASPLKPPVHAGAPAPTDEQMMRKLLEQSLNVTVERMTESEDGDAVTGLVFRVKRASGPRVVGWKLILRGAGGKLLATRHGEGFAEAISWDLLDENKIPVSNVREVSYELVLTDINEGQEKISGRVEKNMKEKTATLADQKPAGPSKTVWDPLSFEADQALLKASSKFILDQVADALRANLRSKLVLEGYADPYTEESEPVMLSKARAEAAARYLTTYHNIAASRMIVRAKGSRTQAERSADPDGINRGVVLTLQEME